MPATSWGIESDGPGDLVDGQTITLSKLQVGAELEIPFATIRGDMRFRPGLRFVVFDASRGTWAREEDGQVGLRSRGRVDFGGGYRLDDGLVLGFESFYSELGFEAGVLRSLDIKSSMILPHRPCRLGRAE